MSVDHSIFKEPKDENVVIWRYLSFTKFTSLIVNKTLYFSSIRQLRYSDPLEGTLPGGGYLYSQDDESTAFVSEIEEQFNTLLTFVNCWHINPSESVAMWKIYLPSGEGVAIQSTYKHLKNSLLKSPYSNDVITSEGAPASVRFGEIEYIDFIGGTVPQGNAFHRILRKDNGYEYERELRAVALRLPRDLNEKVNEIPGISVPVDLATLVDAIVMPPICPDWIFDLTKRLLNDYDVNKPVLMPKLHRIIRSGEKPVRT